MDGLLACKAGGRGGHLGEALAARRSLAINIRIGNEMMERNSSKPRLILPRVTERRKTTYLNGPPFIDDEGLVLVDRRSHEERRGKRRSRSDSERQVCALLRFPSKDPDDRK